MYSFFSIMVMYTHFENGTTIVTGTEDDGFIIGKNNSALSETSDMILDKVIEIPEYFFRRFTNLKTVNILSDLAVINSYSFSLCSNLKSINLGPSLQKLGEGVFLDCTSLSNVTFGSDLETIGASCFSGCTSIKTFDIPKTVYRIGINAFESCTSLESITYCNKYNRIASGLFKHCVNLKEVKNTQYIEIVGDLSFFNCTSITSLFEFPRLEIIGSGAFMNTGLSERLVLPINTREIKDLAFIRTNITEILYCGNKLEGEPSAIPPGTTVITSKRFKTKTIFGVEVKKSDSECGISPNKTLGTGGWTGIVIAAIAGYAIIIVCLYIFYRKAKQRYENAGPAFWQKSSSAENRRESVEKINP